MNVAERRVLHQITSVNMVYMLQDMCARNSSWDGAGRDDGDLTNGGTFKIQAKGDDQNLPQSVTISRTQLLYCSEFLVLSRMEPSFLEMWISKFCDILNHHVSVHSQIGLSNCDFMTAIFFHLDEMF